MAISATEKKLDHLHWPLVLCTMIICTLGVWNLASATKNAATVMWFVQAKWMFIGVGAVAVLLFIDYRWLQTLAWPGYVAALGLLAGVAFHGKKVLGALDVSVLPTSILIDWSAPPTLTGSNPAAVISRATASPALASSVA